MQRRGPSEATDQIRVYRVYDGAGVATSVAFDFKGNPLEEQRQLVTSKSTQPDWSALLGHSTIAAMATAATSLLDAETFSAISERDAVNRVLSAISPDNSEVIYTYDEGGALQTVEVKHRGSSTAETVVGEITYNARGQRESVVYGSTSSPTTTTNYTYDPQTYRLASLSTVRGSDDANLQGLHYHYDPVGNITDIRDTAQQTVYYNNSVVEAANSYTYDATYRLIEATGREHSTQGTTQRTDVQITIGAQPMTSDPSAMRRYKQKFTYDEVGNILKMQHIPTGGTGWARHYEYAETGNRLLATSAPGNDPEGPYTHTYGYDAHGSMTEMPHLSSMVWNHDDELQEVEVGTETVYFQYAGGMRSRKYVEKAGAITEERIYLGPWEIYRKRSSDDLVLERESLHISDGTGRICIIETKTFDEEIISTPTPIWRYQLSNHLGSAAIEVDGSGAVISYEEYHPYGTSAYRAVNASIDVSAKRYRYTGMERDEETGLEYHSARYYAGWLGRWTAADPIGLGDGQNRYGYVGCRPSVVIDPSGMAGDEVVGEVVVQEGETAQEALARGYIAAFDGLDAEEATELAASSSFSGSTIEAGTKLTVALPEGGIADVEKLYGAQQKSAQPAPAGGGDALTMADVCASHHDALCSTIEGRGAYEAKWGGTKLQDSINRRQEMGLAFMGSMLAVGVGGAFVGEVVIVGGGVILSGGGLGVATLEVGASVGGGVAAFSQGSVAASASVALFQSTLAADLVANGVPYELAVFGQAQEAANDARYVFRPGGRGPSSGPGVSVKDVKMKLGRANMSVSQYNIRQATRSEEAAVSAMNPSPAGRSDMTWNPRTGRHTPMKDARGRPKIVMFKVGLQNMEEAITTIGHEIAHINDALAGMTTLAEASAEARGQAFFQRFLGRL